MSELEDARYQINRAAAVKAVAEAFLGGMSYSELVSDAFFGEVEAKLKEMVSAELVAQDEMRQREEDSQ